MSARSVTEAENPPTPSLTGSAILIGIFRSKKLLTSHSHFTDCPGPLCLYTKKKLMRCFGEEGTVFGGGVYLIAGANVPPGRLMYFWVYLHLGHSCILGNSSGLFSCSVTTKYIYFMLYIVVKV